MSDDPEATTMGDIHMGSVFFDDAFAKYVTKKGLDNYWVYYYDSYSDHSEHGVILEMEVLGD